MNFASTWKCFLSEVLSVKLSFSELFIVLIRQSVNLISMIRLSQVVADCSSSDLSPDSSLLGFTRGSSVKIVNSKDLTAVAEFTFPEEIGQIKFSEDGLKFLVLNK